MRRLLLAGCSLVVAVLVAELVVRMFVHVDADGQRWLGEQRILPFRLPVAKLRERAKELEDPTAVFVYDGDLGWAPRPGGRTRDGLANIDESGARRTGIAVGDEDEPLVRIVTLGDSFTFGDEVADDETWPAQLERLLRADGVDADVVNLGVNGYALDQALLRFERDGAPLDPDVVIVGLQPENLLRNLNVVRAVYFPDTSLPLSKPRLVLDGEGSRTVNQPTAPVDEVLRSLVDPTDQPLLEHEAWLDARYETSPAQVSVLYSLAQGLIGDAPRGAGFEMTPEIAAVGNVVIERFAAATRDLSARLVVVHLPRRDDLEVIVSGAEPWHGGWLEDLAASHELVRPEAGLSHADETLFQPGGHYAPVMNERVARALAGRL